MGAPAKWSNPACSSAMIASHLAVFQPLSRSMGGKSAPHHPPGERHANAVLTRVQ